MPDFSRRAHADEWMDDFTITDTRLTGALRDLRRVNRWLGGYAATDAVLVPLLRGHDALRVLDLGTGGADYLAHLVGLGEQHGCHVTALGLDANPVTVDHAAAYLDRALPAGLRERVCVQTGDALRLDLDDGAVDLSLAALFLHHFQDGPAVKLLREMDRVARIGLVVNDLHRHPLAYWGIKLAGALFPTSAMFRNDAPLSVLRGFTRAELDALTYRAGLARAVIRWHWAFRWTLTTV